EQRDGLLVFPSRDSGQRECGCEDLGTSRRPPRIGHRPVGLVTRRETIEEMLSPGVRYSNRIYAELGGGNFMLALDSTDPAHAAQRKAYGECFPNRPGTIGPLARAACDQAAVMALKTSDFDLANFAEQAALRFCLLLLGYSFRDYPL